ncbi:MAG: LamG-like jellyroll fold domain-containing protein [Thermomicrobiales bacterium]
MDCRNIETGYEIPKEGYCDQPYVVLTNEGHWLCVLTTGPGHEGDNRQHVVSTLSTDQGKTWSPLVDIEPNGPPEASWVMPLAVPSGRIYAFYVHNSDNLREIASPEGHTVHRVDTLGHLVFKYTDDGGRTWSDRRYEIPLRVTEIDRHNVTGGKVLFFWGVGKPKTHEQEGAVYFGAAKVGNFVKDGFMDPSEGIFLKSGNILTESDPEKIRWEMLPDGDVGLRSPSGPVADEHNLVPLNDGSLYCTYRTIDGHNAHAYSRDGGHTWTAPAHATYTPGGRTIRHPRAANFVWKASNSKYLLWYHNHGGRYYMDRNPAWLSGGVERDGFIHWSQPEIVLYDADPATRMSYPDFIEQDGRYWITETQKTVARVHEIDPSFLDGLWGQAENREVARDGLTLELTGDGCAPGARADLPHLANLAEGGGFAIDFWITPDDVSRERTIFTTRNRYGRGIKLSLAAGGAARIELSDRLIDDWWDSDPGLLTPGTAHHVAVIVDGGPKIVSYVVDGVLCDGGTVRPKGWHRFPPPMGDVNGWSRFTIDPDLTSRLHALRIYDRYLRTSEAVGNFQAGLP